ncbi:glycosyltransferase family 39 protein [Actinospica robiniae]|uniref:glycosyltransferase family 39 protein n=1 Tax=Actinospica robiniae TaxID=304901 RepID=UPI000409E24D|nr:glycosyltransferase family 39 protein [Actinospica robiniae]
MSPDPQRGAAGSRHKLADILAAEAMAFEGPEPPAAQIPAGRGTRRAPEKPDEPAEASAKTEPNEPAAPAVPPVSAPVSAPESASAPEPPSSFDAFAAPLPSIAAILESSFRVPEQRPAPAAEPEAEPEPVFTPPPFAPQPLPPREPTAQLESAPERARAAAEIEAPAAAESEPEIEPAPESALDSTMVIFPPMPKARPRGADLDATAVTPVVPPAPVAPITPITPPAPPAPPAPIVPPASPDAAVAKGTGAALEAAAPAEIAASPAKTPAKPAPPKAPAPAADDGGHSGSPRWQENVPFDETGVLLRPEALRARAMADETELISAIKLKDDGSEAAQAQRPGFWTGAWARRGMVAFICLVQAVLSLRNNNTAFEDEALYLYSGHLELGHLLYGTSTGMDFWSYFSGAPVLYPVAGAVADQVGGLFGARLLSLAFMLGATCLLYLITRRMFGTRAAVCAAALFCCTEPVVFVGNLATYDAPALFLIALSAWIVVRFARSTWPLYLLAIFPAVLAVGTKYAALMFVPVVICLALLAAVPHFGRWALIRPVALSVGFGGVVFAILKMTGDLALQGVQSTTTNRAQGTNSVMQVAQLSAEWGGALFAVSLAGAAFLIALPREHGLPYLPAQRWLRVCLAALMCGTALLPPLYQAHLHTTVSLQKHVGFGLFFAAPLAGYGLVRMVGPHLHRAQLGIGVVVTTFALGMGQSLGLFHVWPNSTTLMQEIIKYQKPNANYLVGADEVAIYSLRGDADAQPLQFSNTFVFNYTDSKGQFLTGPPAYTAAIQAGYFQVIAYTGNDDAQNEGAIAADLYRATNYKLVATIPETTSYGTSRYYVWVKR